MKNLHRCRLSCAVFLPLLASTLGATDGTAPDPSAESPVPASQRSFGYYGDGSNVYPVKSPPLSWNEALNQNIAWKTPLPGWSWSPPLPLKDRIYVRCDPNLCLHLDRGNTLVFPLQGKLEPAYRNSLESPLHKDFAERKMSFAEFRKTWLDKNIFPSRKWSEAVPVFAGNRLYLRTDAYLYAIGESR
jgi:hypothetical protein